MKTQRTGWIYDVILALLAMALYAPSLRYGFVGDDLVYFIGNPLIASFDVPAILRSGVTGADYAPLRDISFGFDHLLWGANPLGFHLTNIVLYGFTVVAVKHLFVELNAFLAESDRKTAELQSFLVTLVFTFHPANREVVCAVFNRGALMAAFFFILAVINFLEYLKQGGTANNAYIRALLFFVCSLLSREYGIILPLVLALLVFFAAGSARKHFINTTPFFVTAGIFFFVYRAFALAANYIPDATEPFPAEAAARSATALKLMVFYLIRLQTGMAIFSPDHAVAYTLASAGIVAAVLALGLFLRHRHPQLLVGFLVYLVCLIPVLNFFKTEPFVALRYSYLPSLGLFFILMAVPMEKKTKYMPWLAIILILSWSVSTKREMDFFKDNISYWESTASAVPSDLAYLQLGYAYHAAEQYEKAEQALQKVRPASRGRLYLALLGSTCYQLGQYACAIRSLEGAIAAGMRDPSITSKLALAYMAAGDRTNAMKLLNIFGEGFQPNQKLP